MSAQNSLDSLQGDVDAVKRALGRVGGYGLPDVLAQARPIITHAGVDDRVASLVYICALAPDEDENSGEPPGKTCPQTDVFQYIEVAEDRI